MKVYIEARLSLVQTQAPNSLEKEMLLKLKSSLDELINPDSIYTIGKKLLDEGNADLAIHFLMKVRPDNEGYQDAMAECGHYLRTTGDFENAKYYANCAGDTELLDTLDKNPEEIFSFATYKHKTTPTEDNNKGKGPDSDEASSSYSYSQLAGIHGLNKIQTKDVNPAADEIEKLGSCSH